MSRSYQFRTATPERYTVGRQPDGWWIVAITGDLISWAFDYQVR